MSEYNNCPVLATLNLISGKWKIGILWYLSKGTLRYGQLQKTIPNISQKVLTEKLKELQKDGLILKKIYPTVPPKVEYSLTETGIKLLPVMNTMCEFANDVLNIK